MYQLVGMVGLRIKELERIYGIKNGGGRKSDTNNFNLIDSGTLTKDFSTSGEKATSFLKTFLLP